MCGITGCFAFSEIGKQKFSLVARSVEALSKRGPDGNGIFTHNNASLGHARLSIIDPSEKGSQPFTDLSGRYTIVFNGEFYNFKEHRKILERKGISFYSESDTEVLLNLYIQHGIKCIEYINGFFAFAIYDREKESLFIARDRMGIKPLYVSSSDDYFLFASEMKAVLAYNIKKELDTESLYTFLQLNYIPGRHSILKNIWRVEPGYYMEVNATGISTKQYFTLTEDSVHPKDMSYETASKELTNLIDESVKHRLVSDVPLGSFLSGGTDSSIIVATACKYVDKLNTFSIGYKDEPFFDETKYAELVAKKFNTNHQTFSLTNNDLFEHLDDILNYIDEPFADSSAIAVNILSKYTRQHVTVALSGDGADELFSGYNKHAAHLQVFDKPFVNTLIKSGGFIYNTIPKSRNSKISNIARQLDRYSKGLKLNNKDRYWRWCSITDKNEAQTLLKQSVNQQIFEERQKQFLHFIEEPCNFNQLLLSDQLLVLPYDMLTKVDLMSMSRSLEVRTPFLDHKLVRFVNSLPAEYKINKEIRKRILQDSYKNILPAELYNRKKHGFEVPLLQWFRTELKDTITNDLLDRDFIESQGIFTGEQIENIKKKLFSNNPSEVHAQIWALIVFQNWWKKYMMN